MKKIICDDAIPGIRGRLEPQFEVTYLPGLEICREDLMEADALLVRTRTRCGAPLLAGTPVGLVATGTIGMDHFNLPELGELGIEAANAPGCNAPAVAQYVWSTLLRCGFNPAVDTLGVVGKGNVGSLVVDFGRRLGAKVRVCDPPRAEAGYSDEDYEPLETLAAGCDAVTFHTPLTRDGAHPSWHLADSRILSLMKPGCIVVNAARGGVVEEEALIAALREGRLTAIVDTWQGEPHGINRTLLKLARIATPHIAGYSRQGKERATRMVLEAVERHFNVTLDKSGLEGAWQSPGIITPEGVTASYDPRPEMEKLLAHPEEFEIIRESYPLREEYRGDKEL